MVEPKKSSESVIKEKPEVIERREKEHVHIKEKPVVTEVHEKPIIDIHEREQVKHVQHGTEYRKERADTVRESVTEAGREEKLKEASRLASQTHPTKETKEPTTVTKSTETPSVHRVEQRHVEKHEKPLIREVHHKDVEIEREVPIERTIHEKPEVRVHREKATDISTQEAASTEEKSSGGLLQRTLGKVGSVVEGIVHPHKSKSDSSNK